MQEKGDLRPEREGKRHCRSKRVTILLGKAVNGERERQPGTKNTVHLERNFSREVGKKQATI